jgi:tetratricopeptide (TPR) repeat protein
LADLAAIVGKCLASDASDRYGSADRLREDLMNLLTGRPVRAAPPSRTYSLRRFLGRHRLAVSLATALILTLLGLVAAFTWRLAKERDATRREAIAAEKASLESQRVLNFLTEIFQTADPLSSLNPALGKSNVSARELLDRAVLRLQGSLVDQPLLRARILTVVGGVYRALGLGDQAEPLLREGLALREAAPGDHQLELADSWQALGRLEEQRGSYDEARDLLEQAVDTFRALGETTRLGSALQNLGTVQFDQADNENAVLSLTEAVAIHRSTENYDREAESRVSLANALVQLRRPDEAQEHLERGLAVLEAERGDHHPSLVAPLVALASLHSDAGHPADALPILHRASALLSESLGTEDFRLAVIENNLGIAQSRLGNYEEAQKHLGTALVGFERWRGDHPDIGEILNNLGAMEWELHHPKQAETFYRRALEILRKTYPDEHPAVSRVVFNLGEALLGQEDLDGAEIELSHSLELFEAKMGTDHPMVSYPLLYLAQIAETKGQASRAESYFERSLDIRRKVKGAAPSFVDEVRDAYAEFLRKQGRPADALALVDD